MAVIEIAKIQVRRGQKNITSEPTLDSGEFGWAVDTQELWIGNGTLDEGAPETGKTRILTEHDSNLFNLNTGTSYAYLQDDNAQHRLEGIVVYTNPEGNDYTYRKLADKLNDFTTIYDFGGINDGLTDNYQALQNAIDQLWLNADKNSPRSRAALRIPAGLYQISDTLYIPPYTTLIGEGQEKTVIRLTGTARSLIQTCDSDGNYFQEGSTNLSDTRPITNINLVGITFEYDPNFGGGGTSAVLVTLPLVRIDAASNSQIVDCRFNGYNVIGNLVAFGQNTDFTAIELRGQGAIATKDLIIKDCTFDGWFYAINANYDTQDVIIEGCVFRNLSRGIVGGQDLGAGNQTGPVRTRISNNTFHDIEQEAIYFYGNDSDTPTYNISTNNTFKEVGNLINGDANPLTSVINFQSQGNRSIGDYFNRFDVINGLSGDIEFRELVEGTVYLENTSVITQALDTGYVILSKFPISNVGSQDLKVQYSIKQGSAGATISRKGELSINVVTDGVEVTASLSETYSYTGPSDGDIEFSATTNTNTNAITLGYTNTGLASGTISYKFNQLQ
jgi:hypothetical protein